MKGANISRYVNDARNTSFTANATFCCVMRSITGARHAYIQAVRDIDKDEEILVEYGEEYWS
jgi:hypothetical protein